MNSESSAIATEGLSKAFGARKALDKVSFELPRGASLAIFGHNGAGKTTLLRVLATLLRPSGGVVRVLGLDLKEEPEKIRARIGMVSHRSMLYLDLTAEENLLTTARLYGVSDAAARVAELLAAVELTARSHDVVRGFSRGMTQRLAIARALICDPELLFLDEPYTGLDPHAIDILDGLLSSLLASSYMTRTLVMVSHDVDRGRQFATHVLTLDKGRIASFGEV
ncbi:MAG: ABC transporter ATP-binding protein [Coriobacteriales bacterium]|nr:ABC transporter ATP-binding protein [Coriobacteriales bacterium]